MHGDMKTQRNILALALLAGSLVAALAAKLDKTACNELGTELAGMVASGVRDDMGRGPDGPNPICRRNGCAVSGGCSRLEEQLEFRCGGRGKGACRHARKAAVQERRRERWQEASRPAPTDR